MDINGYQGRATLVFVNGRVGSCLRRDAYRLALANVLLGR